MGLSLGCYWGPQEWSQVDPLILKLSSDDSKHDYIKFGIIWVFDHRVKWDTVSVLMKVLLQFWFRGTFFPIGYSLFGRVPFELDTRKSVCTFIKAFSTYDPKEIILRHSGAELHLILCWEALSIFYVARASQHKIWSNSAPEWRKIISFKL